jgi:hypothetical protein
MLSFFNPYHTPAQDYVILKKHEIRNPKFETNPNDQNENSRLRQQIVFVLNFENLNFEFVSNFVLRASNLIFEEHLPMFLLLIPNENDVALYTGRGRNIKN